MSAALVHKAIYDALSNDAELASLLGAGGIYDAPPMERRFPFVQIGGLASEDWSSDTDFGLAHIVALYCWSTNRGRKQIYSIAERVSAVLTTGLTAPANSDWAFILTQPLNSRFERDIPSRVTRATLRFRILAEPTN